MKLKLYKEGKVFFFASQGELNSSAPVFYNPKMKQNRDFTILVGAWLRKEKKKGINYLEPLSASGVRGLRFAKEIEASTVIISDKKKTAYQVMQTNIKINELESKVTPFNLKAITLMEILKEMMFWFDLVDIDPFGSPIYFVEAASAILKRRGVLAVTATDLATLQGVKPETCFRRYGVMPYRTDYSKELGLRVLISSVILRVSPSEIFLEPILSFAGKHYYRIFFQEVKGFNYKRWGYNLYCKSCLWRGTTSIEESHHHKCPNCGGNIKVIGPLWLGPLVSCNLIEKLKEMLRNFRYIEDRENQKLLSLLSQECSAPPFYFDLHSFSSRIRVSPPNIEETMLRVKELGYSAYRTHFSPTAIKSNIGAKDLTELLRRRN